MKDIRQWASAICMVSLAAAILQSILPQGAMERMGRFVVGAFFLCAVIAPAAGFVSGLSLTLCRASADSGTQSAKMESTVNTQVAEESRKSVERLVTAELARKGIACKNVSAVMDTGTEGSISISKVTVRLSAKDAKRTGEAQEYLEKELGLKTEVTADDG